MKIPGLEQTWIGELLTDDREVTEALSVRQEGPQLNQVLVKLRYGGLLATIGPSAYKMLISVK